MLFDSITVEFFVHDNSAADYSLMLTAQTTKQTYVPPLPRSAIAVNAGHSKACSLQQSAALPVLLHHNSIVADLRIELQLLYTSKAMQAAIMQHCKGLLKVCFSPKGKQQVEQFSAWMAKYAQLASILQLTEADTDVTGRRRPACGLLEIVDQKVAHSLQLVDGVKLQSLQHHFPGSAANRLLTYLAGSNLHTLHLANTSSATHKFGVSFIRVDSGCRISSNSIAALTTLRSLHLDLENEEVQQPLVPALAQLTGLEQLFLFWRFTKADFLELQQRLSTRLQGLTLLASEDSQLPVDSKFRWATVLQQPLQLGHLQHITSLHVKNILPCSRLPPALQQLWCCLLQHAASGALQGAAAAAHQRQHSTSRGAAKAHQLDSAGRHATDLQGQ